MTKDSRCAAIPSDWVEMRVSSWKDVTDVRHPVPTVVVMESEWPFDDTGTYRDARIEFADCSGAEIKESRLNGVRMIGAEMVGAEIDGYISGLIVNGVSVMPLVNAELDRLHPVRVLSRSAKPDDLTEAWSALTAAWDATIERARALTESQRHERVRGEWSFTETLRHLVFVVDAWFSRAVGGDAMPYHPFGCPPAFMDEIAEMGIEMEAAPPFDEVVDAWHGRCSDVRDYLASATADDLVGPALRIDAPGWPRITNQTVVQCLHVLLDETWAHHRFAIRDLAVIDGGTDSAESERPDSGDAR